MTFIPVINIFKLLSYIEISAFSFNFFFYLCFIIVDSKQELDRDGCVSLVLLDWDRSRKKDTSHNYSVLYFNPHIDMLYILYALYILFRLLQILTLMQ